LNQAWPPRTVFFDLRLSTLCSPLLCVIYDDCPRKHFPGPFFPLSGPLLERGLYPSQAVKSPSLFKCKVLLSVFAFGHPVLGGKSVSPAHYSALCRREHFRPRYDTIKLPSPLPRGFNNDATLLPGAWIARIQKDPQSIPVRFWTWVSSPPVSNFGPCATMVFFTFLHSN